MVFVSLSWTQPHISESMKKRLFSATHPHVSCVTCILVWEDFCSCQISDGFSAHLIKYHSWIFCALLLCSFLVFLVHFHQLVWMTAWFKTKPSHSDLLSWNEAASYLPVINITSSAAAADEGKALQSEAIVTQTITEPGSVLILSPTPHAPLSDTLRKTEADWGMPAAVGTRHRSAAGAALCNNKHFHFSEKCVKFQKFMSCSP